MALTPEDKKDVSGAMGKAIANKVSKVTHDKEKVHPSLSSTKNTIDNYMREGKGKKYFSKLFEAKNKALLSGDAKNKAIHAKMGNKEYIEKLQKDKSPRRKQVGSYFG